MNQLEVGEALGILNRVTAERDRARDIAVKLLDENGALKAGGNWKPEDIEELVAQVIGWVDGKDRWYDPTITYFDSAREFLDELDRMDNR